MRCVVVAAGGVLVVGAGVTACHQKPACCANPLAVNFDDYKPVNMLDYHTFETYGWSGVQFRTDSGVRCRIYDGPHSFQYGAAIDCWGALPGVPPNMNSARVSQWPFEKGSLAPITAGPVSPGEAVYSFFSHSDLKEKETFMDGPTDRKAVDPASYHLLATGQKIVVPGGRPGDHGVNDAVCAAGTDDLLACELQNVNWDRGMTHGFRLSPHGSQVY